MTVQYRPPEGIRTRKARTHPPSTHRQHGATGLHTPENRRKTRTECLRHDNPLQPRYPQRTAILIEGVDVVVLGGAAVTMPPARARVIAARIREHRAVLVTNRPDTIRASTHIAAQTIAYDGLGRGTGRVRAVMVEVLVTDRRGAKRRGRVVLDGSLPDRMRWRKEPVTDRGSATGVERTG